MVVFVKIVIYVDIQIVVLVSRETTLSCITQIKDKK